MLKIYPILFFLISLTFFSNAQTFYGVDANRIVAGAEKITLNTENKQIQFLILQPDTRIEENSIQPWLSNVLLKNDSTSYFELSKTSKDLTGFVNYEFIQKINQEKVEYAIFKVHCKNGRVVSANGEYYPSNQLENSSNLSKEDALNAAINYYVDAGIQQANIQSEYLSKLYFPYKGKLVLCHKIDLYAMGKTLRRSYLYISAQTGELLFEENRIHTTNSEGTAVTRYNGTKVIRTDSVSPSLFLLSETGARRIHTLDLNSTTNFAGAIDFNDNDNFWNTTTNFDNAAYDAHYGAEKTWDYFNTTFNRNSYDDMGAQINEYVHHGINYMNAFWNGTNVAFGDGDGINIFPFTSTDIVAHEITHAITEYTAGLVYSNESGALNEAFSDVFGVTIDYYANPATANFLMGEQINISGTPFRTLNNPNASFHPDTYQGNYWDLAQEVHTNSNVMNYWYYLLCSGGSGTNDKGDSYIVNSISMAHAASISYRTLSTYLTPNSTYSDMRMYSIQSAIDLFGANSNEEINVTNAWFAVGIGAPASNTLIAQFTSIDTFTCGVPASITFDNNSYNATSYYWDFGDGSTSTSSAPTHVYNAIGDYTVTLIAYGSGSGNSDTMVRTNFIHITNTPAPTPFLCISSAPLACCGFGILNVTLNTINKNSSDATEGFKDFSCGTFTTLVAGSTYPISVTTGSGYPQYVNVYIDYNDNGLFSNAENVFTSAYISGVHTGYISVPSSVPINTPLRLRVISSIDVISGACSTLNYGQAEDYTVLFTNSTSAPIANFDFSSTSATVGSSVSMMDISSNAPTSWTWTINGGTPNSSTLQNPSSIFNSIGTYNVKLVVSNSFGSDSITKTIDIVNSFTLCNPSTTNITNSPSGIIYDSGGPTGNYQNNENCVLLISPVCADSIELSFSAFDLESSTDYMVVYDGTSMFSPFIYVGTSNTLPPTLVAHSGSMLINFISDGGSVRPGFEASWISYTHTSLPTVANFNFTPLNPPLLDTVYFTDASSSSTVAWNWDFGDGVTSTLKNPSHIYSLPGTYTVKLIAHSCNNHDTISQSITIQNSPNVTYSSTSFNVSLGCNDTLDIPLVINNTAGGSLNWNAHGFSILMNSRILFWKYGVNTLEFTNTKNAINQFYPGYNFDTTSTDNPTLLQSSLIGKYVLVLPAKYNSLALPSVLNACSGVIQNFVQNGGMVIFCGDQFSVESTGIFNSTILGNTYSVPINTIDTSTPITDSVANSFLVSQNMTYRSLTNTNRIQLITYAPNYDVVTYMPYGNGMAIYIGFSYSYYGANEARIIANAVKWGMNGISNKNISLSPSNGSIPIGFSDTLNIKVSSFELSAGVDTLYALINTNSLTNLVDTIPIYLNISSSPCVKFGHTQISSCSGVIAFKDSTLNNPTSWLWNFGDGDTSTIQNPTHSYSSAGSYTITLVATNSTSSDSLSEVIVLSGVGGPLTPICHPIVISPDSSFGIENVNLQTIHNSSRNASVGYEDFTCGINTTLNVGSQYQMTVNTFSNDEIVVAWIDFNNDGDFSYSEQVFYQNVTTKLHQAFIMIPFVGVILNTPLRMRIRSDKFANYYTCAGQTFGQTEDYTVIITNPSIPPIADFVILSNPAAVGNSIYFYDISANGPISWQWTINGGTISTSILQNPYSIFNTTGTYDIKLKVSNLYGSDSVTKSIYVVNPYTFCNPFTTQTSSDSLGIIYDSGGLLGNYQNNENCGFKIHPSCADSIVLAFTKFKTDNADYIRIYDGMDASGTLLYYGYGYTLPPITKAVSGSMFINFTTDGLYTDNGFEANWISYTHSSLPPVANFSFSPINPPLLDTVHFTDGSSTDATQWLWDFGDGGISTIENPIHIYNSPGTYTVTLIATSCGAFDTITHTIDVQAPPMVSYSPNSFNINAGCFDTIDLPLVIQNNGGGNLNWNTNQSSQIQCNVLSWDTYSNTSSYANLYTSLNQYFTSYNLTTSISNTSSALQNDLIGKNILLIPPKYVTAAALVTSCSTVIQNFVANGGMVIFCGDDVSYKSSGIFQSTGSGHVNVSTIQTIDTSISISNNIASSFTMPNDGIFCNFTNSNKTKICSCLGGDLVTYLPYGSGKAIYIGYSYLSVDSNFGKILANSIQLGGAPKLSNIIVSSAGGTVNTGSSDTVHVHVISSGLYSGVNTLYALINTNDPLSLNDSIPIIVSISNMPCVNFGYSQASSCSGYISFKDSTNNIPTSWHWNFGDGRISTLKNPNHYYAIPGTYTVTLVATNVTGTDSISKVVTILSASGPISPTCIPISLNPSTSYGIQNVTFNTINHSSFGSISGYEDFSCNVSTNLYDNEQYTLFVTTFNSSERVYAWIDYNNDGIFSVSENVAMITNGNYLHSATINIPGSGIKLGVPLRLRIVSDNYSLSISNPCQDSHNGQCEDYTVIINTNIFPVVKFIADPLTVWLGQSVQFTDQSLNAPTSWQWDLPGASPTNPTNQNPNVVYNTLGYHNATLVATNTFGTDTNTYQNYILINPLPKLAINFQVNYCNGEVSFASGMTAPYTEVHWDFGDGDTSNINLPVIKHTYSKSGIYQVIFVGISPYGNDTVKENISVTLWKPEITKSGNFNAKSPIVFIVSSNIQIESYEWNFGDGLSGSTFANPTHVFESPGVYVVSVTIKNTIGCEKTIYDTIRIIGPIETNEATVIVSPNPFHDKLTIDILNVEKAKKLDIQIINMLGEKIFHRHEENIFLQNEPIHIYPKLVKGNYFIEIFIDDSKYVRKIVRK